MKLKNFKFEKAIDELGQLVDRLEFPEFFLGMLLMITAFIVGVILGGYL